MLNIFHRGKKRCCNLQKGSAVNPLHEYIQISDHKGRRSLSPESYETFIQPIITYNTIDVCSNWGHWTVKIYSSSEMLTGLVTYPCVVVSSLTERRSPRLISSMISQPVTWLFRTVCLWRLMMMSTLARRLMIGYWRLVIKTQTRSPLVFPLAGSPLRMK